MSESDSTSTASKKSQELHTVKRRYQDGVRRFAPVALKGGLAISGGVTLALLLGGGLIPLIVAVASGQLTQKVVSDWLTSLGANTLSGWLTTFSHHAVKTCTRADGELDERALLEQICKGLQEQLAANQSLCNEVESLVHTTEAIPSALDAVSTSVAAQQGLLQMLRDDLVKNVSLHGLLDTSIKEALEELRSVKKVALGIPEEILVRLQQLDISREFTIVSQSLTSTNADQSYLFYRGSEPKWSDILSDRDFERDMQDDVLEIALRAPDRPVFLLINGPSASGKSTLLKRLALELCSLGKVVLVHRVGQRQITAGLVQQAWSQTTQPIYVCVDDIFRKANALDFLIELAELEIPVFVIATCRTSEYKESRASLEQVTDPRTYALGLTDSEVARLISKLRQHGKLVVKEQFIPQLLAALRTDEELELPAVMSRLVSNAELRLVITDEVDSLLDHQSGVPTLLHTAYKCICSLYRFGIPTPASLLSRLLNTHDLYGDVLNRRELRGLVEECAWEQEDALKARHELIAEYVSENFWNPDDPKQATV